MTTSAVLGLAGGLLILIGLVGGGFSFSGATIPAVGKVVRIPCFIIGSALVFSAIALEFHGYPGPDVAGGGKTPTGAPLVPTGASPKPTEAVGFVYAGAGKIVYVYQFPSLVTLKIGQLADGVKVVIQCTFQGDTVMRSDGISSSLWDRIAEGYIPDVYVNTGTINQPCLVVDRPY
jgi:hypothetical protein